MGGWAVAAPVTGRMAVVTPHVPQVQDAQVAMRLYVLVKRDWESLSGDRRPPAPEAGSQDA